MVAVRSLAHLVIEFWTRLLAHYRALLRLAVAAAASAPPLACEPNATFEVCTPSASDADVLADLYGNYVGCHCSLHLDSASTSASVSQWEEALGFVDFPAVLEEVAANGSSGDVRLLKCVHGGHCIGYVLYELRKKGPKSNRQHYCELVNIVVRPDRRSCGAGRRLFEALEQDLRRTAAKEAADLRLYVAERNTGPMAWYRRIGFVDAGWQVERVGGAPVRFLRMVRRQP